MLNQCPFAQDLQACTTTFPYSKKHCLLLPLFCDHINLSSDSILETRHKNFQLSQYIQHKIIKKRHERVKKRHRIVAMSLTCYSSCLHLQNWDCFLVFLENLVEHCGGCARQKQKRDQQCQREQVLYGSSKCVVIVSRVAAAVFTQPWKLTFTQCRGLCTKSRQLSKTLLLLLMKGTGLVEWPPCIRIPEIYRCFMFFRPNTAVCNGLESCMICLVIIVIIMDLTQDLPTWVGTLSEHSVQTPPSPGCTAQGARFPFRPDPHPQTGLTKSGSRLDHPCCPRPWHWPYHVIMWWVSHDALSLYAESVYTSCNTSGSRGALVARPPPLAPPNHAVFRQFLGKTP